MFSSHSKGGRATAANNALSLENSGRNSRIALGSLAVLALGLIHGVAATPWTVVASGLDNPRGLDFAPNGALYVAEAGKGGGIGAPKVPTAALYFGATGAITRIHNGTQERVAKGLPSLAGPDGGRAFGPSGVSFGQVGHALVTLGLGRPPEDRAALIALGAKAAEMATLQQMTQNGQMKRIADLGAFELTHNPDAPNAADSNPFGLSSEKAGGAYVVDAGGNSLLHVSANGAVAVAAVFPNIGNVQAVPTCVARGPDGALYVGQLTGFPFTPVTAKIFRVVPGSAPTVYASGFTHVIDLEFDARGNLYVLEIDATGLLADTPAGRLARINASDKSVDSIIKGNASFVMPGGLAIAADGSIYISNFGASAGVGEVIRIQP
jgi:hypothetical protein